MNVTTAVAKLTAKGRPVMEAIGRGQTSFFDNGIAEGSGIWGDNLAGETGAKPGVLTGLVKQGLLTGGGELDPQGGVWYALTALGAEVAQHLARQPEAAGEQPTPAEATPAAPEAVERAVQAPAERPADAVKPWHGNYNTVFAPAAELLAASRKGVEAWTVNVTAMLRETRLAGRDAAKFAAQLTELEVAANAALKAWQVEQRDARKGQTDMVRYNGNRSFLAGYLAGEDGVPFAKDMAKALRPEALKAGAAARP